jgi:hypothetical protein
MTLRKIAEHCFAECFLCGLSHKSSSCSVIMLNVVMLNVMAPLEVCCAQVAHTTHIPKTKGSNPTTGPIREKIVKKQILCMLD